MWMVQGEREKSRMTPRFLTSAICKDGVSIYRKGEDCGIKSVFRGEIRNSALRLRLTWLLDIPVMLYGQGVCRTGSAGKESERR